MSPQEISEAIIRINQDITGLMKMISIERRPEERQRRGNTIKLKIDELIGLHEKRETVQQPVDDTTDDTADNTTDNPTDSTTDNNKKDTSFKKLTKQVSDGLK